MANSVPNIEFHEQLYVIRIAKRLPRKTIAARAGIDISYLAALERGSRNPPTPEKLEKILNALDVSQKERQQLHLSAFFARIKSHVSEAVLPDIRETTEVVASIGQLTVGDIRIVKAVIDALVANHFLMEAQM